jgi:hypothetical protein
MGRERECLTACVWGRHDRFQQMKAPKWAVLFPVFFLTWGISGCGSRDEAPVPTVSEQQRAEPLMSAQESSLVAAEPAVEQMVEGGIDEAKRVAESLQQEVKDEVQRVAEAAQGTAEALVSEARARVELLMEQVRDLMEAQDYTQALAVLERLTTLELTAEQRREVDGLKADLEKRLSGKAIEAGRKALGGLLEGNKR